MSVSLSPPAALRTPVLGRIASALAALWLSLCLSGCGAINRVPSLEEQAKSSWSEVQNQYQRRADLIPNLVETVKGYAKQEQETLTRVTEARAKATSVQVDASTVNDPAKFKQFQDAQNQLSGALGRLLASVEAYPDLKSNQNFLALQSQLEGTENRIAVARRDYIQRSRPTTPRSAPSPAAGSPRGSTRSEAHGDLHLDARLGARAEREILAPAEG